MPSNLRAVEIYLYKVEELTASNLVNPNDVFIEMSLGMNEKVRTRVHNSAGSSCILKECLQMNYDPNEEDDKLVVQVKNQDMLLASEIGRIEFGNRDINQIIGVNDVQQFRLQPQGKV